MNQTIRKVFYTLAGLIWMGMPLRAQSTSPSTGESTDRGAVVIQQAIEALGGAAYRSVRDFTLAGRFYQLYHGVTSGAAVLVNYAKYPDKERQEFGKKKESILIYNGEEGWEIDFRSVRPLTLERIEDYRRGQKYSLDRILRLDLPARKYRISYDGTEYKQTTKYDVVLLEDANRERITLLFNAGTHLPEAVRYKWVDKKDGGVDRMENWYLTYRRVQGIMTPFHRERIRNGERISQTFVNEVQYNTGLADSLFTVQGAGPR